MVEHREDERPEIHESFLRFVPTVVGDVGLEFQAFLGHKARWVLLYSADGLFEVLGAGLQTDEHPLGAVPFAGLENELSQAVQELRPGLLLDQIVGLVVKQSGSLADVVFDHGGHERENGLIVGHPGPGCVGKVHLPVQVDLFHLRHYSRLRDTLLAAARPGVDKPNAAVVTRGKRDSVFFEHDRIARWCGPPFLTLSDCFVRDGEVRVRPDVAWT